MECAWATPVLSYIRIRDKDQPTIKVAEKNAKEGRVKIMSDHTALARNAIQAGRILSSAGVFMNSPDVAHLDLQTNSPTVHRTSFCPGVGAARMLGTATDNSYQLITHISEL